MPIDLSNKSQYPTPQGSTQNLEVVVLAGAINMLHNRYIINSGANGAESSLICHYDNL